MAAEPPSRHARSGLSLTMIVAVVCLAMGGGSARAQAPSCDDQLRRSTLVGTNLQEEIDQLRLKTNNCMAPNDLKQSLDEQRREFDQKVATLEKERDALRKERDTFKKEGDAIRKEKDDVKKELDALKARPPSDPTARAEIERLKDELRNIVPQRDEAVGERDRMASELRKALDELAALQEELKASKEKPNREALETALREASRCNVLSKVSGDGPGIALVGVVSEQSVLDNLQRRLEQSGLRADLSGVRVSTVPQRVCFTSIGERWALVRSLVNDQPDREPLIDNLALVGALASLLPRNEAGCVDALQALRTGQAAGERLVPLLTGSTVAIFAVSDKPVVGVCRGSVEANGVEQKLRLELAVTGKAALLIIRVR